ncbi:MAG: hypothetical protein WBA68_03290 [Alteraurantiacibacter sp.]
MAGRETLGEIFPFLPAQPYGRAQERLRPAAIMTPATVSRRVSKVFWSIQPCAPPACMMVIETDRLSGGICECTSRDAHQLSGRERGTFDEAQPHLFAHRSRHALVIASGKR